MSTQALAQGRTNKLLRGITNTLTGWVEIPKNIYDVTVETNIARGLTSGLVGGLGMGIVRTGAGVYEVVTFPIECPKDYGIILVPEYVLSETKGEK